MTQGEFDQLTEKYLAGNCTAEEKAFLERWTAQQMKLSQTPLPQLKAAEVQLAETQVWQELQSKLDLKPRRYHKLQTWVTIAASILLLISSVFVYRGGYSRQSADKGTRIQNLGQEQQSVTLPDGSLVILAKEASLTTQRGYGKNNRRVSLQGEAFFKVKPNANLPFLVQAGSLIVEVLGTSFRIKPTPQDIQVEVKTGRVSVYTVAKGSKAGNGVTLSPNQKVVFDVASKTLQSGIVDSPELLEKPLSSQRLQFEDTPIENIVKLLQQDFGVEIIITNPEIKHCTFTGDLNELNLYQQLEIVCSTINADYALRGTDIFISGQGCR